MGWTPGRDAKTDSRAGDPTAGTGSNGPRDVDGPRVERGLGKRNRPWSSPQSRTSRSTALDGQGACLLTTTPSALVTPQSPRDSAPSVEEARSDRRELSRRAAGRSVATFTFPNRILFGSGAARSPGERAGPAGGRSPAGRDRRRASGDRLVGQVIGPARKAVRSSSAMSRPIPTEDDVLAGLTLYREAGCDGLIGLGGGSPIDAAKAIRLLVTHPGRLADYDLTRGPGADRARPAAHGRDADHGRHGQRGGRGALIQLPQTGRKTIVLSPHLLPSIAICDPELTRDLPPVLTAGTGMDAFTHCVESYLSTTFHPICDGIAVEGLRSIFKGLETAVRDGSNVEARTAMMMGALLGGISFHKGLGVVHSLSHALGVGGTGPSRHAQCDPSAARAAVQSRGRRRQDGRAGRAIGAGPERRCGEGT